MADGTTPTVTPVPTATPTVKPTPTTVPTVTPSPTPVPTDYKTLYEQALATIADRDNQIAILQNRLDRIKAIANE
jgi:hypothetical protein